MEWYFLSGRTYRGRRKGQAVKVTADSRPLPDHLGLKIGFDWGYDGGGPRSLGYAILYDFFYGQPRKFQGENMNPTPPWDHYHGEFAQEVIQNLPRSRDWVMESEEITRWLERTRTVSYNWDRWYQYLTVRAEQRLRGFGKIFRAILEMEPNIVSYTHASDYEIILDQLESANDHNNAHWTSDVDLFGAYVFKLVKWLESPDH